MLTWTSDKAPQNQTKDTDFIIPNPAPFWAKEERRKPQVKPGTEEERAHMRALIEQANSRGLQRNYRVSRMAL